MRGITQRLRAVTIIQKVLCRAEAVYMYSNRKSCWVTESGVVMYVCVDVRSIVFLNMGLRMLASPPCAPLEPSALLSVTRSLVVLGVFFFFFYSSIYTDRGKMKGFSGVVWMNVNFVNPISILPSFGPISVPNGPPIHHELCQEKLFFQGYSVLFRRIRLRKWP